MSNQCLCTQGEDSYTHRYQREFQYEYINWYSNNNSRVFTKTHTPLSVLRILSRRPRTSCTWRSKSSSCPCFPWSIPLNRAGGVDRKTTGFLEYTPIGGLLKLRVRMVQTANRQGSYIKIALAAFARFDTVEISGSGDESYTRIQYQYPWCVPITSKCSTMSSSWWVSSLSSSKSMSRSLERVELRVLSILPIVPS